MNGVPAEVAPVSGRYYRIERQWRKGDSVTLHLHPHLTMRRWQVNQNSVSVNYGPLTLSLDIKERYVMRDSKATAIGDSKWQKGADASKWPTTEIYADSPWNYSLYIDEAAPLKDIELVARPWPADDFPWTQKSVPYTFKAKGRRVPSWTLDRTKLCGVLPCEDAPKAETLDDITLVPMGSARLRISAFPVTGK